MLQTKSLNNGWLCILNAHSNEKEPVELVCDRHKANSPENDQKTRLRVFLVNSLAV